MTEEKTINKYILSFIENEFNKSQIDRNFENLYTQLFKVFIIIILIEYCLYKIEKND